MKFARIDSEIQACERHLAWMASLPPGHSLPAEESVEIEAFLTRYLLISIYAEFEHTIDRVVRDRAALVADTAAAGFIIKASDSFFRRIRVSELAGFLGWFDEASKLQFKDAITQASQVAYDNILDNRHETAHGSGSQMTFSDLCDAFPRSVAVLEAFEDALAASIAFDE